MDASHRCRRTGRGDRTRAPRHRAWRDRLQQPRPRAERRPVLHVVFPRRGVDPGGDRRPAHPAMRRPARRAAPGATPVAHVLCAVHRRRVVLLHPPACGQSSPRAVHHRTDARAADRAAVRRDVLLAVAGALGIQGWGRQPRKKFLRDSLRGLLCKAFHQKGEVPCPVRCR